MKTVVTVLVGLVATGVLVYAQNPMRAGRWEVSMQMQMVGMQMPEMKSNQCVTEDDLRKNPTSGLPNAAQATPDNCTVSDYKVAGNRVTWKMACTGREAMTGDGDLAFTGDAYAGTINVKTGQTAVAVKMTGKRLGDCTK
jgi:hypothetical protein